MPFLEHKERKRGYTCLQVSPEFSQNSLLRLLAALQIAVGGFLPPYRFNCLWAFSFHCQFPRFEIGLQRGDFVGGEAGVFGDSFHGHAVGFHAT